MKRFSVFIALAISLAAGACKSNSSAVSPDNNPSGNSSGTGGATSPSGNNAPSGDNTPAAPPSKVNVTSETIRSGGTTRNYVLAVPKTYDKIRIYPLVLVLHGDYGDGQSMRNIYPFDSVTGDDAIVAYPSGLPDPNDKNMNTWYRTLDVKSNYDMTFLSNLVNALKGQYNIDSNRIFGTGYSSGGFMVNFVACAMPLFRAIGVSEGGMAYNSDGSPVTCTAGNVAAIVMQDPADTVVTLDSGRWDAQYWAGQSGCKDASSAPTVPGPNDPPVSKVYSGCDPNFPVELWLIPSIGHVPWWNDGQEPNGAQESWRFFQALPTRTPGT
jgi:polyhydroxybutyrate depolymerase